MIQPKVGMKFYDVYSGTHTIHKIDEMHKGFTHTYKIGKKTTLGFMYNMAFQRLLDAHAISIIE